MIFDILPNINPGIARDILQQTYDENLSRPGTECLADIQSRVNSNHVDIQILKTGNPKYYRICVADNSIREGQEQIFTIEGYVIEKKLPPILSLTGFPRAALNAKQEVFVTAWGDPKFTRAIQNISFLQNTFSNSLTGVAIRPIETDLQYDAYPLLGVSNRYFTAKELLPFEHLSPYPTNIDPSNLLYNYAIRSAKPLVNVTENKVNYFRRRINVDNEQTSITYPTINPALIEVGDLVQLELAIVVFTRANPRSGPHACLPVLRSVILLDSTERHSAIRRALDVHRITSADTRFLTTRSRENDSSDDDIGESSKKKTKLVHNRNNSVNDDNILSRFNSLSAH